jgi:hypothetical protein
VKLCRLYLEFVPRECTRYGCVTPYYRSSSHTLWMKMRLGANKSSLGAHASRDLACPNQLCVARKKGSLSEGVVETGNREVVVARLGD